MTGVNIITYYSPRIFATLGIQSTDLKLFATGFYGIAKTLGMVIFSFWVADYLGRRNGMSNYNRRLRSPKNVLVLHRWLCYKSQPCCRNGYFFRLGIPGNDLRLPVWSDLLCYMARHHLALCVRDIPPPPQISRFEISRILIKPC